MARSPAVISQAKLVAFGKLLQSKGYRVTEHPQFGGVKPVHMRGSWHYSNGAIDVNFDGSNEKAKLDEATALAAKYGIPGRIWQSRGHYDHAHYDISDWVRVGTNTGTSGGYSGGGSAIPASNDGGSSNPLSALNPLATFAKAISDPNLIQRIGLVLWGITLIVIALFSLDNVTAAVQTTAKKFTKGVQTNG